MMSHRKETSDSRNRAGSTRRRFLAALGATGVAINFGGTVLAQDDGTPEDGGTTTSGGGEEPAETFVMGGRVEAWQGVAPESISSQDNPTLQLEADQTYVFVWENLDGQPHNFAIHDENDEPLQVLEVIDVPEDIPVPSEQLGTTQEGTPEGTPTPSPTPSPTPEGTPTPTQEGTPELLDVTETISEEGAMQAVQFTATEEMATYICEIHPTTMVGDIEFGGGDGGGTPTPEDSG